MTGAGRNPPHEIDTVSISCYSMDSDAAPELRRGETE